MKTPLRYQVSNFDCGSTSLLNVFAYLLEREQIPAIIIKKIGEYTLDCNYKHHLGECGTTKEAIKRFVKWLNSYSRRNNFLIVGKALYGKQVTLSMMQESLKNRACLLIRCWQLDEHYVIITKITKKYCYIFDPFYIPNSSNDKEYTIIKNKPFIYNRKVSLKRLMEMSFNDFSLGIEKNRECIVFSFR